MIQVLSSVPGRIRLKYSKIYKDKNKSQVMELYLQELHGVRNSRVNPVVGTILIVYDIKKIDIEILMQEITNFDQNKANYLQYIHQQHKDYFEKEKELQVTKEKIVLFGGIYIIYKLKSFLFGKSIFSSNLTTLVIASVITLIKGYPTLNKIYSKLENYFSMDMNKFLLSLGLIFTLLREGKGVFLLVLKAITDALHIHSNLQIKSSLLQAKENPEELVWYPHQEEEYLLPLTEVEEEDIISFYQNESIIVNGIIIQGEVVVNTMYHTGKPVTKELQTGDRVSKGMVVVSGEIKVKVTEIPQEQSKPDLSLEDLQIYQQVSVYQEKALFNASIMAICSYFITGTLFSPLAVLLAMTPLATEVALNTGLNKYLKLLLRNKIILRNINTIEKIINTDSIAFDKTGTLTEGRLKIVNVESFDENYSKEKLLKLSSNYKAAGEEISLREDKVVKSTTNGYQMIMGSREVMSQDSLPVEQDMFPKEEYHSSIYIAVDEQIRGRIDLTEAIVSRAPAAISKLRASGIEDISIVSGDSENNVRYIANKLGIKDYRAELTSREKKELIDTKQKNQNMIMVGDGTNDLEAMEVADLSISYLDHPCKQAIIYSDCILLEKRMDLISDLLDLTEKSYQRIEQNIQFCQTYNWVFGILSMLGYINPFMAKGLNTINSIIAILNSATILKIDSQDNDLE
ncbi:heavy metal translocating P-type ATPase [Halanaerocella petrolearia]